MTEEAQNCPQCSRKIMQSISNRCMYCGADLPEEHHLTREEKAQLLSRKMEQFRENEQNAEQIINDIRRDFALPGKKTGNSSKQPAEDNAAAIAAALASINESSRGGDGNSS